MIFAFIVVSLIAATFFGLWCTERQNAHRWWRNWSRACDSEWVARGRVEDLQRENSRLIRATSPAAAQLPAPGPGAGPAVWDLVMQDMKVRNEVGTEKYGRPLRCDDGRDALVDGFQEALDLCVYLRKEIEERRMRAEKAANVAAAIQQSWVGPRELPETLPSAEVGHVEPGEPSEPATTTQASER